MKHQPTAHVRILKLPRLSPGSVRVEVCCPQGTTGLTQLPGPMQALTVEQMVTAATFEHEARCGLCDTEPAHEQGDRAIREMTDRAWDELLIAAQRRYDASRRN